MKEQEFKQAMDRLVCVFGKPENYAPLMLQSYFQALNDKSIDVVNDIVSVCIRKEREFPPPCRHAFLCA